MDLGRERFMFRLINRCTHQSHRLQSLITYHLSLVIALRQITAVMFTQQPQYPAGVDAEQQGDYVAD